jgi:hypothetical protein
MRYGQTSSGDNFRQLNTFEGLATLAVVFGGYISVRFCRGRGVGVCRGHSDVLLLCLVNQWSACDATRPGPFGGILHTSDGRPW